MTSGYRSASRCRLLISGVLWSVWRNWRGQEPSDRYFRVTCFRDDRSLSGRGLSAIFEAMRRDERKETQRKRKREKVEGRYGRICRWQKKNQDGKGWRSGLDREKGLSSCTRRQEKNRRMDTSSRTKSVERPVRAVDLFIASLDALTLLGGSSTLSARIDSDERATLLWPQSPFVGVCMRSNRKRERERESERESERERTTLDRESTRKRERTRSPTAESSSRRRRRRNGTTQEEEEEEEENQQKKNGRWVHRRILRISLTVSNETLEDRKKTRRKLGTSPPRTSRVG